MTWSLGSRSLTFLRCPSQAGLSRSVGLLLPPGGRPAPPTGPTSARPSLPWASFLGGSGAQGEPGSGEPSARRAQKGPCQAGPAGQRPVGEEPVPCARAGSGPHVGHPARPLWAAPVGGELVQLPLRPHVILSFEAGFVLSVLFPGWKPLRLLPRAPLQLPTCASQAGGTAPAPGVVLLGLPPPRGPVWGVSPLSCGGRGRPGAEDAPPFPLASGF